MTFQEEIKRRRTFAIISHPDAGKTTLTEKLLLFGGAIHVAGAVKSNKIKKTATSDWMEIEKQRGISVATSVMGFEYKQYKINILDTPGHQDFAEDTFRTLTAVDSVIIVIDAAKGVETQTRKLMQVCRMRKTPVMVFINKMDREGKDPFDLLDEVEAELGIRVRPLSWPINMGQKFKGVYNLYKSTLDLYTPNKQVVTESIQFTDINNPELETLVGEADAQNAQKLRDDVELIQGVYAPFDVQPYLQGDLAPVFFGSALNTFGVKELLECFVEIAPYPRPVETVERTVDPMEENFTGFVFKIHANMDPRNVYYKHVRNGKMMRFSAPTAFMAQKKETVDEAYAGDIVGLPDTGNFKIGDTLTAGEDLHFKGLPSFSPEMFKYIENADPMKQKQLDKGIHQGQEVDWHCRAIAVRGDTVQAAARVPGAMPLGAHIALQGMLDRERRPAGTGNVQETQGAVHGLRQGWPRCVPGRLGLCAPNGAERFQAYKVPFHERVLALPVQARRLCRKIFRPSGWTDMVGFQHVAGLSGGKTPAFAKKNAAR